MVSNTRYLFS
jgi:hypothetical protein